jgi:hypothetical protein
MRNPIVIKPKLYGDLFFKNTLKQNSHLRKRTNSDYLVYA